MEKKRVREDGKQSKMSINQKQLNSLRPSPPFPAKLHPLGSRHIGNNGREFMVAERSTGLYWKLVPITTTVEVEQQKSKKNEGKVKQTVAPRRKTVSFQTRRRQLLEYLSQRQILLTESLEAIYSVVTTKRPPGVKGGRYADTPRGQYSPEWWEIGRLKVLKTLIQKSQTKKQLEEFAHEMKSMKKLTDDRIQQREWYVLN